MIDIHQIKQDSPVNYLEEDISFSPVRNFTMEKTLLIIMRMKSMTIINNTNTGFILEAKKCQDLLC